MVTVDCPQSDITAVNVYTQPSASSGRYLECKKGKKTIRCALHRWSFDEKLNMTDVPIDIGEFYSVTAAEGDECVKWTKPGKDGISTMRNACAKGSPLALTACAVARLKTLLPGGPAPRVMECSAGAYEPGKEPDDISCAKPASR